MPIRFVPATLIALVVALMAVGGAALAVGQAGRGGSDNRDDLLERTAENLGISSQALKDALAQAQSEAAIERQQELISKLVEAGVITQEQADEAIAWLDARPAAVDRIMFQGSVLNVAVGTGPIAITTHSLQFDGLSGDITERMAAILGIDAAALKEAIDSARTAQADEQRDAAIDEMIAKLVEDGQITAAEGDEIKAWLNDMPEWMADHGVFSGLFAGGAGSLSLLAGPGELRHFGAGPNGPFDGNSGPLAPFFTPDGTFDLPGFEFTVPEGEDSGSRFFYRGPGGQFEFNGELPEEFRDLFSDPDGTEYERFELPFDLQELLDGHPFLQITPAPATPATPDSPSNDGSVPTKGA